MSVLFAGAWCASPRAAYRSPMGALLFFAVSLLASSEVFEVALLILSETKLPAFLRVSIVKFGGLREARLVWYEA